ncbi:hypothetical protein SRHO_G00161830 [Serrasalmus rhombeus]
MNVSLRPTALPFSCAAPDRSTSHDWGFYRPPPAGLPSRQILTSGPPLHPDLNRSGLNHCRLSNAEFRKQPQRRGALRITGYEQLSHLGSTRVSAFHQHSNAMVAEWD